MSSATWRANGRASVLMRIISLDIGRLIDDQGIEGGVGHDLGILFECRGDLLLLARVSTVLDSARFVKLNASVASMIAPANARPNDSPNEPAAQSTRRPR